MKTIKFISALVISSLISTAQNGASMEFMMEALSHNNMKTTVGYFAGFEDKDKKDFSENLMKFLQQK